MIVLKRVVAEHKPDSEPAQKRENAVDLRRTQEHAMNKTVKVKYEKFSAVWIVKYLALSSLS